MSSVSGADKQKNRYEEMIRRQREEYQKRENDLIRRHNIELRAISETHQADIDKLKLSNADKSNEFGQATQTALTQKDSHYQDEISKIQKIHKDQLASLKEDYGRQLAVTRDSQKSQVTSKDKNFDQRMNDMKSHYDEILTATDKNNNKRLAEVHDNQKEALSQQRERLNKVHDSEVKGLTDMRTEEVGERQRAYDQLRQTADMRMKSQEARHRTDTSRVSDTHMEQMRQKAVEFNDLQATDRGGYKEALTKMRQDFVKKEGENDQKREMSAQNLATEVGERINNDVSRLKTEVARAKNESVVNQVKQKHISDREVNAYKQQMFENIDDYKRQKDEMSDGFKDRIASDLRKQRSELSDQIGDSEKYYKRKAEVENFIAKESINNLQSEFGDRDIQLKGQSEMRVKTIRDYALRNEEALKEHHKNEKQVMRDSSEKDKLDVQLKLTDEKNQAVDRTIQRMRKMEIEHSVKEQEAQNLFNKEMAMMNEKQTKEKEEIRSKGKVAIENLQRTHHNELEATKMRYEQKLSEINQQHDQELEKNNRKHQAQLDDLLTSVRKS